MPTSDLRLDSLKYEFFTGRNRNRYDQDDLDAATGWMIHASESGTGCFRLYGPYATFEDAGRALLRWGEEIYAEGLRVQLTLEPVLTLR